MPTKLGGYRLTGPFHSDNLPLSAKGEICQGIYHQKEQKVKVIIMSSQVIPPTPKSPRLNIVLWRVDIGHERKGGGTVIETERDVLTDRK